MILWLISDKPPRIPNHGSYVPAHVVTFAADREAAKREAQSFLRGDRDHYVCTPLTSPGDQIRFELTLPRY